MLSTCFRLPSKKTRLTSGFLIFFSKELCNKALFAVIWVLLQSVAVHSGLRCTRVHLFSIDQSKSCVCIFGTKSNSSLDLHWILTWEFPVIRKETGMRKGILIWNLTAVMRMLPEPCLVKKELKQEVKLCLKMLIFANTHSPVSLRLDYFA